MNASHAVAEFVSGPASVKSFEAFCCELNGRLAEHGRLYLELGESGESPINFVS